MELFRLTRGSAPLLVSMPHVGTYIPPELAARMTEAARVVADTDWHVDRLYDFLDALGASVLCPSHSRYVVDLNRPPDGLNLYPGQDTTALVPVDTFAREAIYAPGETPDEREIAARVARYWRRYHDALRTELARIRSEHGYALLWDAHSIASELPRFFAGRLPDLNFGTASSAACAPAIEAAVFEEAGGAAGYTAVLNGRFKGGYITRAYGRPADRVHAIQLELSQRTYMNEARPFEFREDLASRLRPPLRRFLEAFLAAAARSA
jgi:N-formylglutamate deformylase